MGAEIKHLLAPPPTPRCFSVGGWGGGFCAMPQGCDFLAVLGAMGTEGRVKGLWGGIVEDLGGG